ncbi:transposase [Salinadaptatus halalkaliphilus]|uniref:Transposase n=1 Tax=Salinadaptatus halalkaliphilus TaxID=2419781 RepID=A0A4S3TLF6_9EURY|nr:transposase [Salinadaptatus halalkaliphilus]THE65004.1 transposase [Salinadaptatus halalkaliphilus]
MTRRSTPIVSRRRALAGVAAGVTTALAGCTGLLEDEAGSTTFAASEVEPILSPSAPDPEWPVAVTPESRALEAATDRIDELLAAVPDSLEPADIPNGVVREEIQTARDEAAATRSDVADAAGRDGYHALRESRGGREHARKAATVLGAIDADTNALVDDLEDERTDIEAAVADHLADITYRGPDTVDGRRRAALYAYRCESDLMRVETTLERWQTTPDLDVLELGDDGATLEFAAATTAIWDYFDAQYEGATDEPVTLESTFEDALERANERTEAVEIPDQSRDDWFEAIGVGDLDNTQLEFFLWDAGRPIDRARDGIDDALREGHLATGLSHALELEHATRAFAVVRDRVDGGFHVSPDSIEDVRTEREAAIEAAEAAQEELSLTAPSLGAYRFAETLESLGWVDSSVARGADNDPDVNVTLGDELGDYARIRAEFEVFPAALEAFRERLDDV